MYEIKRISPFYTARLTGLAGIVCGIIPTVLIVAEDMNLFNSRRDVDFEHILALIIAPLVVGLVFYISTAASIAIYNLITPHIGGCKIDLEFIPEDDQE